MVSKLFLSFVCYTMGNKLLNLRIGIVICCTVFFFLVEILCYIAEHCEFPFIHWQ